MIDAASIRTTAVIVAMAAAFLFYVRTGRGDRIVSAVDSAAARRGRVIFACSALAFVGSALIAVLLRWPEPAVHDEFAYLLAADTFASGRLANPTHEYWHHFETFYVLQEPTYASRFPPAQGFAIALGMLMGGSPVVGLWLSAALMAGAICWALYGFVSERWAMLGGLAVVCQIGVATYWTQSFWGGAVAAAAGALVFGATMRLLADATRRDAVLLGLGLVVLANARPFEGAMLAIAPAFLLIAALVRGNLALRSLVPTLAIGLAGLVFMGAYNHSVVGSWWMPPYVEYERQYAQRPVFSFQESGETKTYRHDQLESFFRPQGNESEVVERHGALISEDLAELREFLLGRVLLLPFLIGCLLSWRTRGARFAVAGVVLSVATLPLAEYFRIHYVSAAVAPVFVLVAIGFDRIGTVRVRGLPVGGALCAALLASSVLALGLKVARVSSYYEMRGLNDFVNDRADVTRRLEARPGADLVFVEYGRGHNPHREWVYNRAGIDDSDIVWARDMGAQRNAALADYFSDRAVWKLHIDESENVAALDPIHGAGAGR